jgi:L-seryl-tRNA(Ser) seleniumtransferase
MRKNPLCRAFRVDKVTLAGLGATLRHYLDPEEALREIPALRMLAAPHEELEARARAVAEGLEGEGPRARMTQGSGVVGGGTCPGVELPSWTVRVMVAGLSPQELAHRLRTQDPPVVARVENDEVVLDLRTVDPKDDSVVLSALQEASRVRE